MGDELKAQTSQTLSGNTSGNEKEKPVKRGPAYNPKVIKAFDKVGRALPFAILGVSGYGIYVYSYVYLWREVAIYHSRTEAIALICVFAVLVALILTVWVQLLLIGPGIAKRIPAVEQQTADGTLPKAFVCGPEGYPMYCSQCQSVKASRVHHSSELSRCVPKMDHFCFWVGAVIGRSNYKYFVHFVLYMVVTFVLMITSMAAHAHAYYTRGSAGRGTGSIAHVTILFALSGFWLLLLVGFIGVHVGYLIRNLTTIEHMKIKRSDFLIFNFLSSDGNRVVSRMRREDPWPYDLGSKLENFKSVMGPTVLHWLLPLPVSRKQNETDDEPISERFIEVLDQRWKNGQEGYLAFAQNPQTEAPQHANSLEEKDITKEA